MLGDCDAIQMTMAFDPNTDIMWILDSGHVLFPDADDPFLNYFCPAKEVAIKTQREEECQDLSFQKMLCPLSQIF